MASYRDELKELAEKIKGSIGVDIFAKAAKGRIPSQVGGEFITNRGQGDWAEELLLKVVNSSATDIKAISYGRMEDLVAGDPGFKEFFEKYKEELSTIGKCPDLLIFKKEELTPEIESEISSDKPRSELMRVISKALAGIEVRSSAFIGEKYAAYRKLKETNKRAFLSFTPKIEDLAVILRWVEKHNLPHFYVQVLFDSMHIISFKKILELLSDPSNKDKKFFIEKNYKNRFKDTIHIALSEGYCLSKDVKKPLHKSQRKELTNGRLVHYVSFEVGELPKDFDMDKFKEILGV